ncbi:MAG: glycine--tRNA ligase subunit beta, partial [Elusimicrobia bacterium]|nr:glycine--tRNA ligase subunit beta [Elusimicrobiota bacterium]
ARHGQARHQRLSRVPEAGGGRAMKSLLLEIGTEHLPARFIAPALAQLSRLLEERLKAERVAFGGSKTLGTPRRLAIVLKGVAEKSEPAEILANGPNARLWKDEKGQFTPQAAGFAKAQGVRPEDLRVVASPKGEVLQARRALPAEPTAKVLARLLPELIAQLQFPKGLEWEPSRFRFGRPIRSLVALLGKRVIPFQLAGVRSGSKAPGLGVPSRPVSIPDADRYASALRDRCILADVAEREASLSKALDQAVRRTGAVLDKDPELLYESVFLTEHPVPVLGRFDPAFLTLPKALLSTVLKKQLKFFPLQNADGTLFAGFVGVRDGISEGQALVQEGYQRVLTARFADAHFFHGRDLETKLEAKLERLKKVSFGKALGTMHDKQERVSALAEALFAHVSPVMDLRQLALDDLASIRRIARLAYADLATDVVREFPELQGAMGGHYCRNDGEDERIAIGVSEFYAPAAAKAPVPSRLDGCLASLAGKLDTLAALFLAEQKPSGSEDPFALRRQATGVVRIVLEKQLALDLDWAAGEAVRRAAAQLGPLRAGEKDAKAFDEAHVARTASDLSAFLWQRVETLFGEMGYPADEVRAVREGGLVNLPRTALRAAAVHALRPDPDFATVASAFKRASNILKQAKVDGAAEPEPERFAADAERALFDAMRVIDGDVRDKAERQRFEDALRELVGLKPAVDRFFEEVLVMDPDEGVRANRLALLARLVRLFKSVADISHIQLAAPQAPVQPTLT